MKAKYYLESYEHLYRQTERITEQIAKLDAKATGTGAIRYDKDRVMSSNQTDLYANIDRKVHLESVIENIQMEMDDIEQGILEAISSLPLRDQTIAKMTWLEFEGSVYISQVLHINQRTVFRRRGVIINTVQGYLDSVKR